MSRSKSEPVPAFHKGAIAAVAAEAHSCIISPKEGKNRVLCWGDNNYNQISRWPAQSDCPNEPHRWCSEQVIPIPDDEHPVALATGTRHTCALTGENHVFCWGVSGDGQCGLPTDASCGSKAPDGTEILGCAHPPQRIPLDEKRRVLKIVATWKHACAVLDKGNGAPAPTALCWGIGSQLDADFGSPKEFSKQGLALPVEEIVVGGYSTCVVSGGKVYCNGAIAAPPAGSVREPVLIEP